MPVPISLHDIRRMAYAFITTKLYQLRTENNLSLVTEDDSDLEQEN